MRAWPVRGAPVASDDSDDDVAAELDAGLGPAARQWSCDVGGALERARELSCSDGSPRLLAAIQRYTRVKDGEVDARKQRLAETWGRVRVLTEAQNKHFAYLTQRIPFFLAHCVCEGLLFFFGLRLHRLFVPTAHVLIRALVAPGGGCGAATRY